MVRYRQILSFIICAFCSLFIACGSQADTTTDVPSTYPSVEESMTYTPSPTVSASATEEISDEPETEPEIVEESTKPENPTQIINDIEVWETIDIPVESIPEDVYYIGATENGFFYYLHEEGDWRYYFYSFDGQITEVFNEEDKEEYSYSAFMMTDISLLLTIQYDDRVTTYQVYEDGTTEEILTQTSRPVPERYCTNKYIYFTQYDTFEDGSETGKVLRFDRSTKELEVLYQTEYANGNGQEVYAVGGTDEEVFLAVRESQDYYQTLHMDYRVIKIDPDTKAILSQAEQEYSAPYITGSGSRVLITEDSFSEFLSESGKVYMWEDSLENPVVIPGLSASDHINWSMKSGERIIMHAGHKGYIWDLETDIIYRLDFKELHPIGRHGISSKGFSCLVPQEDGLHFREMRLK